MRNDFSPDSPAIYCVSLTASVERSERMRRRLGHHGLLSSTSFVDAVPAEGRNDGSAAAKGRAASACFASHLKALRVALADPHMARTGAIVCEDDILLHNDFTGQLLAVLGNLPEGTSLCSLGYMVSRWDSGLVWAGREPRRHNLCHWVPGALWSTHLYWVSAPYAREVIERYGSTPIGELPPMTERILNESNGLASVPPLALQDVIDSTIRPSEELDFHFSGQAAWSYADYSDCEQGGQGSPLRHRPERARPTIGLCMIVRDEAAVIGRCIESVRDLIDCWRICDTGSSDGTIDIVRGLLADLPGELHERTWRDFGWNRSELMAIAADSADYLLLLDADMTVNWTGPLPPLKADAYLLRHAGEVTYVIPRLVRGDRRWRFEGSTHEYLTTDGPHDQELLEVLAVEHHADGGARAEKFQRDAALLERDLQRDSGNVRATFYLAQTYRDQGDTARAVEFYQRRAEMGGWDEEIFYSTYQAGALLAECDHESAIKTLLLAWQRRPQRAEPLYELVRLLRYRRQYHPAYLLARYAVELERPEDLLFVHRWIYDWGVRFELAVAAYWVGDLDRALELNDMLLSDGRLPPEIDAAVRENQSYCLAHRASAPRIPQPPARGGRPARRDLPSLQELCPSVELRALQLEVSPAWPNFNPTIAADGDGFRLMMRTANYRIINGRYHFLTGESVIRTINYMVRLDRGLEVVAVAPLLDNSQHPPTYPVLVQGYEDCRVLRLGETWAATATVRDRNPAGRCEMALLLLEENTVTGVRILKGPSPARDEKNWMPFCVDGALHALYSCDPTVVLRVDPGTGTPCEVARTPGPPGAANFRGGSQGVQTRDGLLFVVHEALDVGGRRAYSHRFVLVNREYAIAGVSPAFHFAGHQVEFCAGLAQRNGELLLTFGLEDRAAALAVVAADEVINTLKQTS